MITCVYHNMYAQRRLVADKNQIAKITIQLPTMYCKHCSENIRNSLLRQEAILSHRIHIKSRKVDVEYLKTRTNPNNIRAIINNSGYKADTLSPLQETVNLLPVCCRKEINKDTIKYINKIYRQLRIKVNRRRKNIICCFECDLYYLEIIRNKKSLLTYYETYFSGRKRKKSSRKTKKKRKSKPKLKR